MSGVLCIDLGTKKHGFATADRTRLATQPLEALRAAPTSEAFFQHIEALLAEREVGTLLLGLPRNADGSEGPQCVLVRKCAQELSKRFPMLRIELHDEHLTTKAAQDWLVESELTKQDRKRWRDSAAALLILRDWLG